MRSKGECRGRAIARTTPIFEIVMKPILHISPLLVLNLGCYVLIKLIGSDSMQGNLLTQLTLLFVLGCAYLAMTLMWLRLGKHYQLSFIYPIVGLNYVVAAILGVMAFGEPFAWQVFVGAASITTGVALISSTPHRHESGTGHE